jgi:hypothetical protein
MTLILGYAALELEDEAVVSTRLAARCTPLSQPSLLVVMGDPLGQNNNVMYPAVR